MKTQRKNSPLWSAVEKISSALIGVDLIALIQLIGLPHLNLILTDAAIFFAASLPILAFVMVSRLFNLRVANAGGGLLGGLLVGFGAATTLAGTALLTFHLSLIAGVVFCILLVPGLIVVFVSRWPDDA